MRTVGVVSLGGLSALHVVWAAGSAWPAADRRSLADAVGGFSEPPGPVACLVVAKLLAVAGCCVAGVPSRWPQLTRLGSGLTCLALVLRAAAGFAGLLPHARRSKLFAQIDRRVYSPVCLGLAFTASVAMLPDTSA